MALVAIFATTVGSAHAEAGLLERLVGRRFVVPDAAGAASELLILKSGPSQIDLQVAGQTLERYRLLAGERGEMINPSAPDLVSSARFAAGSWSRTYRDSTTTFALNADGDLIAERTGDVEPWQDRRYVYGFNPDRPNLAEQLSASLHRIKEEAERFEGHSHDE